MRQRHSATRCRLVVRPAASAAKVGLAAGGVAFSLQRYALTPLGNRPPRPWGSV
jgi:hypothetical protein